MKNITFLSTLLATTILAGNALAETGSCGGNCIWVLDGEELKISVEDGYSTAVMDDYARQDESSYSGFSQTPPWYNLNEKIKKVSIGEGVTNIGRAAFRNATNLTTVEVADSVTSIGGSAFYKASNLTSVLLSDTSKLETIGGGAFKNTQLSEFSIPSSVVSIGGEAFFKTPLTHVTIPPSMSSIDCFEESGIKSITIPDGVTSLGWGAFLRANITEVNFGDNPSLTTIEEKAFRQTAVTKLDIPETVTVIGASAFDNSSVTSLLIEGTLSDETSQNAFSAMLPNVKIYCQNNANCYNKGAPDSSINIYTVDKSGAYFIDGKYYATAGDLLSDSSCEGGLTDDCIEKALAAKTLKLLSKGKYCTNMQDCSALVNSDYNGEILKVGLKSYASLDDLMKGKHIPKLIYTMEEAMEATKNGDKFHVSLTYK